MSIRPSGSATLPNRFVWSRIKIRRPTKLSLVTNAHHLEVKNIAALYRERWQIEFFLTWIKGNLKINTLSHRHIPKCGAYLDLDCPDHVSASCFLEIQNQVRHSLEQMPRLLLLNLFERRNLIDLFKPPTPPLVEYRQFFYLKIYEKAVVGNGENLVDKARCFWTFDRSSISHRLR